MEQNALAQLRGRGQTLLLARYAPGGQAARDGALADVEAILEVQAPCDVDYGQGFGGEELGY